MKRQLWLQNPITKEIWDLTPQDPNIITNGCAFVTIKGMGYAQNVTQNQVGVDYFVSEIETANKPITGNLFFANDEHLKNFQAFIGDFRKQFTMYYSPEGEYQPYDRISSPYYKKVIISELAKTEKDEFGWYVCNVTFTTQSDVWCRDLYFELHGTEDVGEALVYPYYYNYIYGGRNTYAIELNNEGREVGCKIQIKNTALSPITQIEWFIEHTAIDYYGVTQTTVQRSKWYTQSVASGETITDLTLYEGYELLVDSNPVTQEAKVIFPDSTSQSVVALQEPSWEYINFVRIKNGQNKIVFYIESKNVDIILSYQEQKEII